MRKDEFHILDKNDLAYNHNLNNAITFLTKWNNSTKRITSAKKAISLYAVHRIIEKHITYDKHFISEKNIDQKSFKTNRASIKEYFNKTLTDANKFINIFLKQSYNYRIFLLEMIYSLCLDIGNNISNMNTFISSKQVPFECLLCIKPLVKTNEAAIIQKFTSNPKNLEIFHSDYIRKKPSYIHTHCYPKDINQHIPEMIEEYIKLPAPARTVLNSIADDSFKCNTPIDLRYKAKQLASKKEKEIWDSPSTFKQCYTTKILCVKQQELLKTYINDKNEHCISYNWQIAEESKDDPLMIITNMIHLFCLFDFGIVSLLNNNNELSSITRCLQECDERKESYSPNIYFNIKMDRALYSLNSYKQFLDNGDGYTIETAITWFFNQYLVEEFGIKDFSLTLKSRKENFEDGCTSCISLIEAVPKFYKMLVEDGLIDKTKFEFLLDKSIPLHDISSLNAARYIYPKNLNNTVMQLIYSDQSILNCIEIDESERRGVNSFFQILNAITVNYNSLDNFLKYPIDYLIEQNQLLINSDGNLELTNKTKSIILERLYHAGEISYYSVPKSYQEVLNDMLSSGEVEASNKLFTRKELDFLDYILNSKKFRDSLNIRNNYSHGAGAVRNEENCYIDYLYLLIVVLIIVLKINDDLIIKKDGSILENCIITKAGSLYLSK